MCVQTLPEEAMCFAPPTWDSHLLHLLASSTLGADAESGVAKPFVGCCWRLCINLKGNSEAALRLQKCLGCQLVRCMVLWCMTDWFSTSNVPERCNLRDVGDAAPITPSWDWVGRGCHLQAAFFWVGLFVCL